MSYEFTPTGDLAVDLAKIYNDANGIAKPMSAEEMAAAESAAILIATEAGVPPYEMNASSIKMDGAQSAGSLSTIPRADHVHPSDTSKVSTSGDETIAGVKTFESFPLTPSSAPTTDYQVPNKKYVDESIGAQIIAASWQTGVYYKAGQLIFDPAAEEPKLLYRVVTGYTSGVTFETDVTDLKILLVGGAGLEGFEGVLLDFTFAATSALTYILPITPRDKRSLTISANGAIIHPEDYSLIGDEITFDSGAVQEGWEIFIKVIDPAIVIGSVFDEAPQDNDYYSRSNGAWVNDPTNVKLTGDQTIGGTKHFSSKITANISGNCDGNAGTVTNGVVVGTVQTISGRKTFTADQPEGASLRNATGNIGGIQLLSAGTGANAGAAFLCFHRSGNYATYLGLDTDNYVAVGGWSAGAGLANFKCHTLSKAGGTFNIEHPHPDKKDTHRLVHSFIEGPKADLIYSGMVFLKDGKTEVNIDLESGMTEGTFELLCRDVRRLTSNESGFTPVKSELKGNILTIISKDLTCNDEVFWQVIGERKDKYMIECDLTDEEGNIIIEPKIKEDLEY